MSAYPYWLLTFDLRDDVDARVLSVLRAVADGEAPDPLDLDPLPDPVRSRLVDPRRMLSDQEEPFAGTPVRLARSATTGLLTLTVELCLHDDEFAEGGWMLYLWLLHLARRPAPGAGKVVIGHHGLYRGDGESTLLHLDSEGVTEGDRLLPFTDLEAALVGEDVATPG